MEFRFDVEKWNKLSADKQSQRCHQLASEVRQLAHETDPHCQRYLSIARAWEDLAVALSGMLNRSRAPIKLIV